MTFTAIVVTVSDGVSSGEREDESGPVAEAALSAQGFELRPRRTVPDEAALLGNLLIALIGQGIDLIVTTGGTGFGPRDITPEATRSVIDREAPGLSELMRAEGRKSTPMAALSRGIAGSRATTLIINLPGSPKGARESLDAVLPVLPHALETLCGYTAHPRGTPKPE